MMCKLNNANEVLHECKWGTLNILMLNMMLLILNSGDPDFRIRIMSLCCNTLFVIEGALDCIHLYLKVNKFEYVFRLCLRQNNNSNTYKNMQQKVGPKNYPTITTWDVIANKTWKPWWIEGVEAGKIMQTTPLEWSQKLHCSG